jgi:PAS domain S-box-containing protein
MNTDVISVRAAILFREAQQSVYVRADRLFANLMILQWLAGIAAALWISPKTWIGASSQTHWHVWAAVVVGGAITSLPVFLAFRHPGRVLTRHVIAVAQMLTSALLIHLTGGRIETHFHVFGSLAFFAFYRDWRVLLTGTIVVALDHMARGIFWPQSVFGVLTSSPWRWLEHAGWVIFEDAFLLISIRQSLCDVFEAATRRATLEVVNASIEQQVFNRTAELRATHRDLEASEERFRMLSASAPIGILQTDATGRALYTNQYWQKITGLNFEESLDEGWKQAVHPDDHATVFAGWKNTVHEGNEFDGEFRFRRVSGEVRWVHLRSAATRGETGEVTSHVGTVEDITDRKQAEADLASAHKKLIDASRRAGMAEVATGVLHNVGNVLTSVNVASSCVAEGLKKSKVPGLYKLVALMRENEADLGSFLMNGERGKQIQNYLVQLAESLTNEQAHALKELAHLQTNIDHIKDIVSMQQSHAKVSGVTEPVLITDLLEDALRMNSSGLARQDFRITREYESTPVVTVEKQKVLQILVNLVRNAEHACDANGTAEKRLTLRVTTASDRVRVAVIDNGVGIPAENLARIFHHGFTTRKDGHGFGLHSGALAARELGGSLQVHSDGPGQGAMFTLELPLKPLEEPMLSTDRATQPSAPDSPARP